MCLQACMCTVCMSVALKGQEGVLEPLELELQAVVSHHVGAGNPTQPRGRAASTLSH